MGAIGKPTFIFRSISVMEGVIGGQTPEIQAKCFVAFKIIIVYIWESVEVELNKNLFWGFFNEYLLWLGSILRFSSFWLLLTGICGSQVFLPV